jgi:hypothetical protein
MLLNDLGINPHRKISAIAEIFDAYGPEDYVDIIEEWKSAHMGSGRAAK